MISCCCSSCGMKWKLEPEFAGQSSKCPNCKKPLVAPSLEQTKGFSPAGPIEGSQRSLARAGVEDGVTLDKAAGRQPVADLPASQEKGTKRYVIGKEIARGGMGAVLRAVDRDIRREVAVKYLLNQADARSKSRFVEEGQITGQLEHPNIVPVHELGVDSQGRVFFAMKMVKGRSLAQVLDELRQVPRVAEKDWPLGRLLTIFVNVCNALSYAHSRGVVHRDLKPANIMIGDFGEVYVMDWGLAKVLHGAGLVEEGVSSPHPKTPAEPSRRVVTDREEADLTQDGAILGTPVYMPPEQALGNLSEIDQRSDIYSLGAILYELLTLQPPVDKEGGHLSILMRVTEGRIEPPEVRAPKRAREGKIPRELSAVAMKALAKDRAERYSNVEALRRDIEWFQEGRSVSAKEDTFREMAWKLVKRNKGASITGAAALVLLAGIAGVFLKLNYDARVLAETERNQAQVERNKAEEAYQAYQKQVKDSVPAFVSAAKMFLNERQFDLALVQANLAAGSAPDNAEARLLKGELLITRKRFAEAIVQFEKYQELNPDQAVALRLAELCRKARTEEPATVQETASLLAFANLFTQAEDHALADGVLSNLGLGMNAPDVRLRLLEIYRKRIDAAWPGKGNKLNLSGDGRFSLYLLNEKITDLMPLRGIPLDRLELAENGLVRDLTPLKGMPLTFLGLNRCFQVQDLTPLDGMPLTHLNLAQCSQVRDVGPLKGMPLSRLILEDCRQVRDLEPLRGMPLTTLILHGTQVRDLEPLRGMPLTTLNLHGTQVHDLGPLEGMPLTALNLFGCAEVRDLAPLKGMRLTFLNLDGCPVRNLEPLKGMPLTDLNLGSAWNNPHIRDLELLKGMPLTSLRLAGLTQVQDLEALRGMRLTTLALGNCNQVRDLELLKGMPLSSLQLWRCPQVRDLAPLKGMPLKLLWILDTGIADVKPLQSMQLEEIRLTPNNITHGLDILRDMKSLKTIGVDPFNSAWPAAEFWARYDKREFKK